MRSSGYLFRAACELLMAGVMGFTYASCDPRPAPQQCVRRELGSMGPENSFRLSIAEVDEITIDDASDRIDVAMTLVPPVVAPVMLVQRRSDGTETRWQLEVVAGSAISTRCAVASTPAGSSCKATLAGLPAPMAGDWSVEAGGNFLIEAGLSVRLCE